MSDERTDERLDLNAILDNAEAGGSTDPQTVVRLVRTVQWMRSFLNDLDSLVGEALTIEEQRLDVSPPLQEVPVERISERSRARGRGKK